MTTGDSLQRFIFEHAPIRGEIVHLDATWQAVLDRRVYPPRLRDMLGEMMAAAALLTATLKFDGRLIMQVQGKGPVNLLMVECTSNRTMRAIAQWTGDVPEAPLSELVGDGRLAVTIDPSKGKERYQAIVELEGLSVAEAFENYFAQSEQLETRLWLAADPNQAAGMLLQRLPDRPLTDDEDAWGRAVHLGSTITREELLALPVHEIIHRLYHEEDIRLFSRMPVSFRCSCSRERVESVLRMLGRDEIHSILAEQGTVRVDCEFCGSRYEFDRIDAEQLFASLHSLPAANTRH
ncbi:MAG: Hsp33 family molecular chaperone HslO [Gammaproteobacteria bacterium]|nr:Hsp33 family molecular chaperone HslO [Gammaproteobacteria bacterium]MDH3370495.1 Hsp33 family molecular chaperone HslO [Gammaproteobacteria bacterium]MDH3406751.1 Hsp33 family molecular chaperone HslO [Gammaproteobacteria bacterium]MDH5487368.1 Hsp33 family molecular chaperone HslO [Gammaproteobacteria bacterium]